MVQKKLPLINSAHGSETRNIINELIKLFNNMGYTYNESLQKAQDILAEAQQTNDMNESVQQQINTLIAESGTSDAEVLQARIDAEGNEYPVLKERLDEKEQNFSAQLAETNKLYINAINPPAPLSPVKMDGMDTSTELNNILIYAYDNNVGEVRLPGGTIGIASSIEIPFGTKLIGSSGGSITKARTVIQCLVEDMTGIVCNHPGFQLKDFTLNSRGDRTGIGIYINSEHSDMGVGQNWLIENVRTEYFEWSLKTYFSWIGMIKNCSFMFGKYGLHLQSQSNVITVESSTINTSAGDNLRIVNSAGLIIRANNITQAHLDSIEHKNSITILGGSSSNILFDTNYFEGSFEDVPLIIIGQNEYTLNNPIDFRNNTVTGLTKVLRIADLYNVNGINFDGNFIPYTDTKPFQVQVSNPTRSLHVRNNTPNNWGFTNRINENIEVNGSPFAWNGGENEYPDGWSRQNVSVQTKARGVDGSYEFTTDSAGTGFYINLNPKYCYYPTVKFKAKASSNGTLVIYFRTDKGLTRNFALPITTDYEEYDFILPLYAENAGLAKSIQIRVHDDLVNETINIKDVKVIPSSDGVYNEQLLSFGCPTHGTWVKNQYVTNLNMTVLGDPTNMHIVKGWHRLTDGETNVLGVDWLEDRQLIGS